MDFAAHENSIRVTGALADQFEMVNRLARFSLLAGRRAYPGRNYLLALPAGSDATSPCKGYATLRDTVFSRSRAEIGLEKKYP